MRIIVCLFQAVKCRLASLSNLQWTERASQRLLSLIPDEPLLLKVISEGSGDTPPNVELFKRLQPQNELVSINATLALDNSLFR